MGNYCVWLSIEGEKLVDFARTSGSDIDALVYPIVFLFRDKFELSPEMATKTTSASRVTEMGRSLVYRWDAIAFGAEERFKGNSSHIDFKRLG